MLMRSFRVLCLRTLLTIVPITGAVALEIKPGAPVPGVSKPFSLAISEELTANLDVNGITTPEECNGPGDVILSDDHSCSLGGNFVFSGDVVLTEDTDVSDVLRFPRQVIMTIRGKKYWTADWVQLFSDTDSDESQPPADVGIPAALTDALGAEIARTPDIPEFKLSPTEYEAGDATYMVASDGLCQEGNPDAPLRSPQVCPIPEPPGWMLFLTVVPFVSLHKLIGRFAHRPSPLFVVPAGRASRCS